jgi:hypothetical protein
MKLCSRPENYGANAGTMTLPGTLAGCRSSLIEQGQLEVAGAGPLAIALPLAAPPFRAESRSESIPGAADAAFLRA